jgi:ABC-type multidrug transport system ATPase subunit
VIDVPAPEPLLALSCTKQYRTGTRALAGVDLTVNPGELVAMLGPNGSGKATLVHGIVGLHSIEAEALAICGHDVDERDAKDHLGFVPDELPVPLSLTGWEYLDHLERLRGGRADSWRQVLIDELGLAPHLGKFIGDMSHGTKKKLQIIAAVQHVPKLLVLDEPLRGLDPRSVVVVRGLLDALRSVGAGVLVATHDVLAAERWFDRVHILAGGVVIADGTPQELVAQSSSDSLEGVLLDATRAPATHAVTDRLRARLADHRLGGAAPSTRTKNRRSS